MRFPFSGITILLNPEIPHPLATFISSFKLPKGAKRFEDLQILDTITQQKKEKTSYHIVLEAIKKGKEKKGRIYLKIPDRTDLTPREEEALIALGTVGVALLILAPLWVFGVALPWLMQWAQS